MHVSGSTPFRFRARALLSTETTDAIILPASGTSYTIMHLRQTAGFAPMGPNGSDKARYGGNMLLLMKGK